MEQSTQTNIALSVIDLNKIHQAKLETSPYDYIIASDFIRQEWKDTLIDSYPHIFRRSDHSYHGHLPFEGTRQVIQMNWVTHPKFADREQQRHRWSAFLKKFTSADGKI